MSQQTAYKMFLLYFQENNFGVLYQFIDNSTGRET